jgi:hypothetical protein
MLISEVGLKGWLPLRRLGSGQSSKLVMIGLVIRVLQVRTAMQHRILPGSLR